VRLGERSSIAHLHNSWRRKKRSTPFCSCEKEEGIAGFRSHQEEEEITIRSLEEGRGKGRGEGRG